MLGHKCLLLTHEVCTDFVLELHHQCYICGNRHAIQVWATCPGRASHLFWSRIAGEAGLLLLFCDQQRGLSQRQRSWAAAIASKLSSVCL